MNDVRYRNLRDETIAVLAQNGKTPRDVLWIGSRDGEYECDWETFARLANAKYYASYGGNEVPLDLVVVGADWWLERGEYDGSEWWEFQRRPEQRPEPKPIKRLLGAGDTYSVAGTQGVTR